MTESKQRGAVYASTRAKRIVLDARAIGGRIAAARKARRWTAKQLAEALGVHESTVHNWTCGARIPQRDMLCLLSVHLRRSIDWLCTGCEKRGQAWRMLAGQQPPVVPLRKVDSAEEPPVVPLAKGNGAECWVAE